MEIRNVGGINPSDNNNRNSKINKIPSSITPPNQNDSYKVSDEAMHLEDEAFIKDVLSRIPDIDYKKLNNIKNKLDNGEYETKEVLDVLTEKLAKVLGL